MSEIFSTVLSITLWSSAFIAALLCVHRLFSRRISAGFFRLAWLVLALRLAIPFNLEIKNPPVKIDAKRARITPRPQESSSGEASRFILLTSQARCSSAFCAPLFIFRLMSILTHCRIFWRTRQGTENVAIFFINM